MSFGVMMRRCGAAGVLTLSLVVIEASSCGPSEIKECDFSLRWHDVVYLTPAYLVNSQGLTLAQVRAPHRGRALGKADLLQCPDDEHAVSSTPVYSVQGVPTATAIVTEEGNLVIAQGKRIPPALIK